MKKAICYGSVSALGPHRTCLEIVKDVGFDGIEISQFDTLQEAQQVAELAENIELEIHSVMGGTPWRLPLSSPDQEVRAQGIAGIEKALRIAQVTGGGHRPGSPGSSYRGGFLRNRLRTIAPKH